MPDRIETAARSGGSSAASARTAVDLPVARSPKTMTPPMLGSMAAIRIASYMSSWPTIGEKGKTKGELPNLTRALWITKCKFDNHDNVSDYFYGSW